MSSVGVARTLDRTRMDLGVILHLPQGRFAHTLDPSGTHLELVSHGRGVVMSNPLSHDASALGRAEQTPGSCRSDC